MMMMTMMMNDDVDDYDDDADDDVDDEDDDDADYEDDGDDEDEDDGDGDDGDGDDDDGLFAYGRFVNALFAHTTACSLFALFATGLVQPVLSLDSLLSLSLDSLLSLSLNSSGNSCRKASMDAVSSSHPYRVHLVLLNPPMSLCEHSSDKSRPSGETQR